MTVENPTADSGASISERLENFLAASENPQPQTESAQPDEPKEVDDYPEEETPDVEAQDSESDEPQDEETLSLSDVAKILGVDESTLDVDEDGSVKVKTKIDGKEGAAKFQDLVKSYQLQGHIDAKAREAAEAAKVLNERVQQFEQFAQTEAQKLSQLAHIANQELMRDVADIDWDYLSRNDPVEYIAKQQEFSSRQARVNALMQEAETKNSQWQQAQQLRYQQTLESEAQRLPTLIPEWADAKVRDAEKVELRTWAKNQGFTDQDLAGLTRADMVSVLRKAWLYDKGATKTQIAEKKLRAAPKLVKPGVSADSKERAQNSLKEMRSNIRKSGGRSGIAEYLMASGKV